MMAEEESIESHARITYLEKASHILSDAIKKFGSSDLVSLSFLVWYCLKGGGEDKSSCCFTHLIVCVVQNLMFAKSVTLPLHTLRARLE